MKNKLPLAIRLTPEAIDLIKTLSKELGVSQADIVEMSVRLFSKNNNSIQESSKQGHAYDLRNL